MVDLSGSTDTTALAPVDAKAAIKAAYQKSFQGKRELEGEENADSAESNKKVKVEEAPVKVEAPTTASSSLEPPSVFAVD